jgi:orotate phosphoribosyltransferase
MSIGAQRPPVGTRVVIVDDVVTTGASINAATDACHAAGLRVVGAIAIADATGSIRRGESW